MAGAQALVAMHPDEATDAVVDAALVARKPFAAPRLTKTAYFSCFWWFFEGCGLFFHGFSVFGVFLDAFV